MKGFRIYKTIQLILCILIAAGGLAYIFLTPDLFHAVANVPGVTVLFAGLWVLLAISFLFIILDFSSMSKVVKNIRELDHAVHSDPSTGLANRYSCDMIIEKYLDKKLPDNIAAIMFDIINIQEINHNFGHLAGNVAIRDFSNVLLVSAAGKCFVGRNGGNKFLAIFEGYTKEGVQEFLDAVAKNLEAHNAASTSCRIEYKYGSALAAESSAQTINQLIAEANRKIYE